ncbi:hypothetical protein [Aquamicrobium sp. LC103]|uniref:hypothetical protein n=1 Tax=Aquamicrobium sp. LC103 TaxID=1120658 RepID=UPI00063E7289|nr:hypothetical protein [Aquamicrobium sp. LC103]TKT74417.1 hypothetical protein XW59_023540 [Aquamicrobium sp. LC103]
MGDRRRGRLQRLDKLLALGGRFVDGEGRQSLLEMVIHNQSLTLQIDRSWDEVLLRTAQLRPKHSQAALLTWTLEPPAIDAGVPAEVAAVVSEVATFLGSVAFRIFFPDDLPTGMIVLCAPKRWLPVALYQRFTRSWPADIAVAAEAAAAAEMFLQDWQLQGQMALVLGAKGLEEETLDRLRKARNWNKMSFPTGVRLLVAPAVDGDGILLATHSAPEMDRVLGLMSAAFARAGLPCTMVGPPETTLQSNQPR